MGNGLCQSPRNTPLNPEPDNLIRCLFCSQRLTCDFVSYSAAPGHIQSLVCSSSPNLWWFHIWHIQNLGVWPYSATQIWCSESCYWNNAMLSLRELNGSANNMGVSRISKWYVIFYQCLAQINNNEYKYTHTFIYTESHTV